MGSRPGIWEALQFLDRLSFGTLRIAERYSGAGLEMYAISPESALSTPERALWRSCGAFALSRKRQIHRDATLRSFNL